jgi:glyoxalase family protein
MTEQLLGIHHITAIAGDPQKSLNFYAGVLGLRLVKLTVNFDDPFTYHFYFGDCQGRPGTIMTFFPWPDSTKGRRGSGQATVVSFAVPQGSMGFWTERFRRLGVPMHVPEMRFNEEVLMFTDPDGLHLELVADDRPALPECQADSSVPPEHAVRGFHGFTVVESDWEATDRFVHGTLGFRPLKEQGSRLRYAVGDGFLGMYMDVLRVPAANPGLVAVGTVHHVAWRTPNRETQLQWQRALRDNDHHVTPVIDRQYFNSIYFHEPGHLLFEIATDPPGFGVDERPDELGTHLTLPPWLEPKRSRIESELPRVVLPGLQRAA